MRTDILPLCDKHYRTMEFSLAPFSVNYSIEFFRCTDRFCHRCFHEALGYVTPVKDAEPIVLVNQPKCEKHGRPMFISSVDRQRNLVRHACPEPNCHEGPMKEQGVRHLNADR
ncbi:MAG: hypothetical protein M3O09_04045 [Acidobacteriota bacterium]|nr:hypothetical protein [Acidobacteriota bacterium]